MFTCTEPKMKKKYYDEISSILIVKKNVENFSWNFLPWNSLISKGVLVLINANQNPAFIFKTREFQGKIQTLMDGKKSDFFIILLRLPLITYSVCRPEWRIARWAPSAPRSSFFIQYTRQKETNVTGQLPIQSHDRDYLPNFPMHKSKKFELFQVHVSVHRWRRYNLQGHLGQLPRCVIILLTISSSFFYHSFYL